MKIDLRQIKKYVIHNMDRKDREEHMQKEFTRIFPEEEIEVFPAIMNKIGKVGCWKSFQAVVKKAKDQNLEHVLIMEDDIVFPILENTKEFIDQCFANVPSQEEWDILLGGIYTGKHYFSNNLFWKKLKDFSSTHFSFFHKTCFDKILNYDTDKQEVMHFDRWLGKPDNHIGGAGLRAFVADPAFAAQYSSRSDITKQEVSYRMTHKFFTGRIPEPIKKEEKPARNFNHGV